MHIYSFVRAVLAACVLAAVAVTPVSAAPIQAQLRVEGPSKTLDQGNWYVNNSSTFTTTKSCGGTGARKTLEGPTALGLLNYGADFNPRLDPVGVSDEFDFGLFVCAIGDFPATGNGFWGFRVNHAEAQVGADQYPLKAGDSVLWTYIDFDTNLHTGKELVLMTADNWVKKGRSAEVRILEYDAEGKAVPAVGVEIGGEETDATGDATIKFTKAGRPVLRGFRGADIPTAPTRFCVWEKSKSECETLSLATVVGTGKADVLKGGAVPETIVGRGGKDRINVRDGGTVDVVKCGAGNDVVIADKADRIKRDCETAKRK